MPSKEICNLVLSNTTKSISIENTIYENDEVSTLEWRKFKKKLVDSGLKQA